MLICLLYVNFVLFPKILTEYSRLNTYLSQLRKPMSISMLLAKFSISFERLKTFLSIYFFKASLLLCKKE